MDGQWTQGRQWWEMSIAANCDIHGRTNKKIVPGKVSEDDKLIEYDALLLDHFFQILHDLYDEETQERVSKNHARKVSWLFRHFAMQ